MKKIELGDKVKVTTSVYTGDYEFEGVELCGKEGTVRYINKDTESLGVEFNEDIMGHSLANNITSNNGFFLDFNQVVKVGKGF